MNKKSKKVVFVKNLPFDANEDDLKTCFSQCGEIKRCFVVKDRKTPGKSKGIGYITFTKEEEMKKCVKLKVTLRGRKLEAIPAKPRIRTEENKNKNESSKVLKKDEEMEPNENDESMQVDEVENEINHEAENVKSLPKRKSKNHKKKLQNENKNHMDSGDDEEQADFDNINSDDEEQADFDNINSDDEEENEDDKEKNDNDGDRKKENDDDEEEEEDEDGDEDENESNRNNLKNKKKPNNKKLVMDDAEEGKTLFIRNLSFDSTEEDLFEFFEDFGDINYCRVVINPQTDFSRGTAFVKFRRKEDADSCLEQFQKDENAFALDGRKLILMRAVTKEKANSDHKKDQELFKKASQKNLHLIKLTTVRYGTKESNGMSKEDGLKRKKVEEMTKQKLKNPNIFVSDTRICVRNIPATMTDKELKETFIKILKDSKAKIIECRIMRDLKRVNSEGTGKSKGYAFMQFKNPQHAMQAVLATNNNPHIFSNNKRPIVDFSLENRTVLDLKMKRQENSKFPNKESSQKPRKKKFTKHKKL